MTNEQMGHRLRCVTVKAGIVNICPDCGHAWVTDFTWDFQRDPAPELGPIVVNDDTLDDFVGELREIAPTVWMPCLPSCEERDEAV